MEVKFMSKKLTSKLPVIFCFLAICLLAILTSACSSGKKPADSQKSTSSDKFSLYLKGDNLYMARYNNSEIIDLGPCTTNGSVMKRFSIAPYSIQLQIYSVPFQIMMERPIHFIHLHQNHLLSEPR